MKKKISYKRKFEKVLANNIPIYDKNGNQLTLKKNERWIQAYDRTNKIRKRLPKYWFLCLDTRECVSVHRDEPLWLTRSPKDKKSERWSYSFNLKGRTKTIKTYNLFAICCGSRTFGKAEQILKERGLEAFGDGDLDLNGHHELAYENKNTKKAVKHNNNPENICILTGQVHDIFNDNDKIEKLKRNLTPNNQAEINTINADIFRVLKEETDEPTIVLSTEKDGKKYRRIDNIDISQIDLSNVLQKYPLIGVRPLTDDLECISDFNENRQLIIEEGIQRLREFGELPSVMEFNSENCSKSYFVEYDIVNGLNINKA